jgi:UDP-N-acetylglucosamine 2-epimerase (non-hydrolysing)
MKQIKVLSVIGTRPEAIKMAPVISGMKRCREIDSVVCSSGQHREMLASVLKVFQIKPDLELNIMRDGQDLTDITCGVLSKLREIVDELEPNLIVAQGDTTTTMATSLAAYYKRIPFWHIEAGLRSGDKYSPWPEEVNRKIAGVLSDFHFAPTEHARQNLLNEGVADKRILVTGNTVIDALFDALGKIRSDAQFRDRMHQNYPFLNSNEDGRNAERIILVTGHRRESFGAGFESICLALKQLAQGQNVRIVYPVHLNPNVRDPVFRILGALENVELLDPLEYLPFVYLMDKSYLILTDSGGVQEEAPSLGKPVLVMRDVTERGEGVAAGVVKLVGTATDQIVREAERLLRDEKAYQEMSQACNPYGDGKASQRIIDTILAYPA